MTSFGIRASEFGEVDEHYVGADPALFDWLVANNYEQSDRESLYLVKAPAGYVFLFGSLYPENDEDGGDDFCYVSLGSPENDKALMLMEGTMKYVDSEEFYSLGIDEDRILDYLIY